jgi:hypothetical protein
MGAKTTGFDSNIGPMASGWRGVVGGVELTTICTLNRRHKASAYSLAKSTGRASAALQYP